MQKVDDANNPACQNNGFSDNGSFTNNEYLYDLNGNMIQDLNKEIGNIDYAFNNLPKKVVLSTIEEEDIIYFWYDAAGKKLRKQTRTDGAIVATTDYTGSFVYENGFLQYILTDEGRIVYDRFNDTYQYQYFLKDHLGNTRILFDENGTVLQDNSYYPFGMAIDALCHSENFTPDNNYLYNGKELQDDFGLEWYDYGARFYDPQLGCWHVIDPLAETYFDLSPFSYVANNPLKFIDPNGMLIDDYFNRNGAYLGSDEAKTDNIKIIDQKDWDDNKTVSSDGSESIEHTTGNAISTDHSKSNITEEATLNVYDHYNPTCLDLKAKQNENGNGGLTFHAEKKGGKTSEWIDVKIEGNKRIKVADHANEIINSFAHEGQHYSDYQKLGFDGYVNVPNDRREQRAVSTQMKHTSYNGTRHGFQQAVKSYGQKHGMIFPLKPKQIVLIPISK